MYNTVGEIIDDARNTVFTYKGDPITLMGEVGDEMFQSCRMLSLANESANMVSLELHYERNFKKTFMNPDSNIIAMPTNFMSLEKILIYHDSIADASTGAHDGAQSATVLVDSDNTFTTQSLATGMIVENTKDNSKGTITAVNSNSQITHSSLQGGTSNVWNSGDTFVIYNPALITEQDPSQGQPIRMVDSIENLKVGANTIYDYIYTGTDSSLTDGLKEVKFLSGLPEVGILFQTEDDDYDENVDIVVFNKRADARYHVDVVYYPTVDSLAAKSNSPKLKKNFRQLIYSDLCTKIAMRLGDFQARVQHQDEYERLMGICQNIINAKNPMSNVRPRFGGVGLSNEYAGRYV